MRRRGDRVIICAMRTKPRLWNIRWPAVWLALGLAALVLAGCGRTIVVTPSAYGPLMPPPTAIPTLDLTRQVIYLTRVPVFETPTSVASQVVPTQTVVPTLTLTGAEIDATKAVSFGV